MRDSCSRMRRMSVPAGRLSRCRRAPRHALDRAERLAPTRLTLVTTSKYVSRAHRGLDGLADRPLQAEHGAEPQRLVRGHSWPTLALRLS